MFQPEEKMFMHALSTYKHLHFFLRCTYKNINGKYLEERTVEPNSQEINFF